MIRKTQIYYYVLKLTYKKCTFSNIFSVKFSFTTSAKLLFTKRFFFTFFKTFILILLMFEVLLWKWKWVESVTFDYNVGQTGTVFITHFDLWWHFITLFSKLQNLPWYISVNNFFYILYSPHFIFEVDYIILHWSESSNIT